MHRPDGKTLRLRLRDMSQPLRHGTARPRPAASTKATDVVADDAVVRDAEQSLVAALQESDTALEAMHDAEVDGVRALGRRRLRITVAGVVLAAIALLVTRRRS